VLEQSDDVVQALTFYDHACKFAPDSAMVAYKRIRVLVALQRIDVSFTPSIFVSDTC
jgi:anaphase-promoting complex subunit 3